VNNFGSNGQRHAVLGLMECLHPALHDGPCFERIDRVIVEELIKYGLILTKSFVRE
jgi:hypothetical protein